MKKSLVLFVWICMIVPCAFSFAAGGEQSTAQVTTEQGSLNLRSLPEPDAALVKRIPNGSLVTVIQTGDVFWEIQYGNSQGYAMCEFLTPVDSQAETEPAGQAEGDAALDTQETSGTGTIAQVTTEIGPLNLRSKPDNNATVLLRIPNRSLVTVVSQGDEYWEIAYGDSHGYASCEFLTMTDYSPDTLAYRVLYRGNKGNDVVALKERLMELGYYRSGSVMNNDYNETCVDRIKLFQRQNGLKEDGVSTAEVQARLFSDAAVVNTEALPAPKTSGYVVDTSSSNIATGALGDYDNFDWNQWMLDHPGVCPCCMGSGCNCCNYTGKI